jgi:GH15 family glucan-1,4-alpha-glucosidase
MKDLVQASVDLILRHQAPSGGFVASPTFPTYQYCWYRDGAFIAYAMDLYAEHASAARFHGWAANAILGREHIVQRALTKVEQGEPLSEGDILHTRYRLDGRDAAEEWPNFQLDGFGAWLWALNEHRTRTGNPLPEEYLAGAQLAADYIRGLWRLPCYDCWEEFPDQIHAYTLAAIHGGLTAYQKMSRAPEMDTLHAIERFLRERLQQDGHFVKYVGTNEVDANLIGLALPFRVVDPTEPLMSATVERIEQDLLGGGVHRYRTDTYYGGGEWVLLTAWLGWYYAELGETERAETLLRWVEAQADESGHMPEQVAENLNAPSHFEPWRQRWGDSARPLLWSHAKYLILVEALARMSI